MSVATDLYTALHAISNIDRVDDTKAPDGYLLTVGGYPAIVFSLISDVPDIPIGGAIAGYTQRWQVSVRSLDLAGARTAKAAVVAALHGLKSTSIQWCQYEGPGPVLFEDGTPAEYHAPIDFLLYA